MRQEVIAGQFLDVEAARKAEVDVAEARRIAVLKSGRYSIEEPMLVGAALAGAPDGLVAGLAAFGGPLGEAFQLRDDLLGTFGDRSSVGKPVDSDIREGKRHVLFAYAAAHLDGADRQRFLDGWGRGDALVAEDVEELRDLLVRSGARAYTEDLLEDLRSEAGRELARLGLPDEARAALEELARRATDRQL
jgi:geranylgeranyl diphosphate synthase type I